MLWQFCVGNWLNSPRCWTDAFLAARGVDTAFSNTPYWAKFTFCVDPYWVNQWLKNYAAGFVKRGLLGSLVNLFSDRLDLVALNIFAFLCLLLIAYSVVFLLVRLIGGSSIAVVSLVVSLLWLSPFGKVFSETAGDPLQIVLCGWLLVGSLLPLVEKRYGLRPVLRDWIFSLLFIVSILIYEGSFLLLLVPFFSLCRKTPLWWCFLFIGVLLVWSMSGAELIASEQVMADSLVGFNPWSGLEVSYRAGGGIASQVSFMDNFWMQLARYQDAPRSVLSELRAALSVFIVWLLVWSGIAFSRFDGKSFSRGGVAWRSLWRFCSVNFINLLIISPFLFVTHDWVRYLAVVSVLMLLVRCVESSWFLASREPAAESKFISRLFVSYALLLSCVTWRLGPFDIDVRTSLPSSSRMPYTILAMLAFAVFLTFLWVCRRRCQLKFVP